MNYEDMSDFEIEVEVTKIIFPFVLDDGYGFVGSRDGFIYTRGDKKEHKLSGNRLICTVKNYCNNPSDAWPIIVENGICINAMAGGDFTLWYSNDKHYTNVDNAVYSENPLRAAMICFLKMKDAEK